MSVDEMLNEYDWEAIPNCPGRYRLMTPSTGESTTPQQLARIDTAPREYNVTTARDTVLVLALSGGGLISYRGKNGGHFHTLNTEQGLARKLRDLGIVD